MIRTFILAACVAALVSGVAGAPAGANAYREKGRTAIVAKAITVTPPRDWNKLAFLPGKHAETWTLDGEQLNEITFYGGVEAGQPLVREVSRKRKPLPRFTRATLLVEVPELLEGTYRAGRDIGTFSLTGSAPGKFLGRDGIRFTYDYVDGDNLPRKGEAHAALIGGRLYMATFDAPRLHYFDRVLADFHALIGTARLP